MQRFGKGCRHVFAFSAGNSPDDGGAAIDVFITLEAPTLPMQELAISAGHYESELWGRTPRLLPRRPDTDRSPACDIIRTPA